MHCVWAEENALYYIINVCGSHFHCMYHQHSTAQHQHGEKNCMRNAGSLNRSFPTVEWNTSIGQQHQSTSLFRFCLFFHFNSSLSLIVFFRSCSLALSHTVFEFIFSIFLWTCVGTICCCIPELKLRFLIFGVFVICSFTSVFVCVARCSLLFGTFHFFSWRKYAVFGWNLELETK